MFANYSDTPQNLIKTVVKANFIRKVFIADEILKCKLTVIFYEPTLKDREFYISAVINDLEALKQQVGIIVANRSTKVLADVGDKVLTCDLFGTYL